MSYIDRVETFVTGVPAPFYGGFNWMFVKVTTNDGVVGWGECNMTAFRHRSIATIIEEISEHFLLGRQNPFNIEQLWSDLYGGDQTPIVKSSTHFRRSGMMMMQALASIEMACWDIVGKCLGQPIYNLLGGKCRSKIRTYTYLVQGWKAGEPPEKAAEAALAHVERGFTALKLDPIPPSLPQPREIDLEELAYTEAVLGAIRSAVGNRCDLLIGTHGQLTTHAALRFARTIEPFEPFWFEEPVPQENMRELARVARSTIVPIATGERLSTKWEFQSLLHEQAAQILQPNIALNGILETKKIAAIAEANYAQIAPWIYCGPIATAAAVQLDTCIPNFLIQEGINDWGGYAADICKEPIRWERGYVRPPEKPGLGVELDEDVLRKNPAHEYSELKRIGGVQEFNTRRANLEMDYLRKRTIEARPGVAGA
jgi:2-dehydro-3-deoxyphosphogalactonate aldolase